MVKKPYVLHTMPNILMQTINSSIENNPYLLHIDLNILLQTVSVQIEDQVVHKVESVAYNDERQLVG